MKAVTPEEQRVVLKDLVSAVDGFCREHNIRYSIACGTLLGAVRHGGFIPWDDDVDIYMLRSDFEQFEKMFPDGYLGHYTLITNQKNPQWHLPYGKVVDTRTLVNDKVYSTVKMGLSLDVFLIDDVPDDERRWRRFRFIQRTLIRMNLDAACPLRLVQHGLVTRLRVLAGHVFMSGNRRRRLTIVTRFITRHNNKGYHRCFESVQGLRNKHPFDKSLFDDLTDWKFEDRVYQGFRDADNYLRNTYGDYMKLPPVEKRVALHPDEIYWI